MKFILLFLMLFCLSVGNFYGQNVFRCGLPIHIGNVPDINPVRIHKTLPRSTYNIPIVFHSLYQDEKEFKTDKEIHEQLEILNLLFSGQDDDFATLSEEFRGVRAESDQISFCLANEEGQEGIIRLKVDQKNMGLNEDLYFTEKGGSSAWNTKKYLNIWIADTGENFAGFGTFPGQVDSSKQGVVVNPKFFGVTNSTQYGKGKVLVHEIAHYLGLNHPWSSCENNDNIEDTPTQEAAYFGCPTHPKFSCESLDLFHNYMDYVDDQCMYLFTRGQYEFMLGVISSLRVGLIENDKSNCFNKKINSTYSNFSIFPNPTKGEVTILFEEASTNNIEIELLSINGQTISIETRIFTSEINIDLSHLDTGLYYVKIGDSIKPIIKI